MAFSDQGAEDKKQHLNLSIQAWETVENDRNLFSATGEPIKLSTFLNHIFTSFYKQADASIALRADDYEQKLLDTLSSDHRSKPISKQARVFIDKLKDQYITELIEKKSSYVKGAGQKFRLNTENYNYLTGAKGDSDCNENLYYSSIGSYLKALYEEYCSKSQSQREEIFFRSRFIEIQNALNSGKAIRITHVNMSSFEVKPYKILQNRACTYHYLTGYARLTSRIDRKTKKRVAVDIAEFRPWCMRISNIEKASIINSRSGFISAEQTKLIEKQILQNGTEYLANRTSEIKVRLTARGKHQYKVKLFNRPPVDSIDGDIYTFHCAEFQIQIYFLSFCEDAEILEPPSLRQNFEQHYKAANAMYSEKEAE